MVVLSPSFPRLARAERPMPTATSASMSTSTPTAPSAAAPASAAAPSALPHRDPSRVARAEQAFAEGQKLVDEGRFAEGCERLEESQRIDAQLGTLLNLAFCNEQRGLLATAREQYLQASAWASLQGAEARQSFARARAEALTKQTPYVQLVFAAPETIEEVHLDGAPLARERWGVPIAVDPGRHRLNFSAKGRRASAHTLDIEPFASTETVLVPRLVEEPTWRASESSREATQGPRTGGWVLAGAGVATLVVGAGLGIYASTEVAAARDGCGDAGCDLRTRDRLEGASTAGALAYVTLGLGAAATAGGLYLLLRDEGTGKGAGPRAALAPRAVAGGGVVTLTGRF
jgi:hypothetical protein